jgi:ribosomal-protein-serine acetyltransferase
MTFPISLDEVFELRILTEADAATFFAAITKNLSHLDPWLHWSDWLKSEADVKNYLAEYDRRGGFHAGIWQGDQLAGGIVSRGIDQRSKKTEIGYWLDEDFVGRGLVSRATRKIITYLFQQKGLHRVEIVCAENNSRSRAIPERLGFTLEAIMRESEWNENQFVNQALYSLLEQEWEEIQP